MSTDPKGLYDTSSAAIRDASCRINYLLTVAQQQGRMEEAKQLNQILQTDLILIDKSMWGMFSQYMTRMGNDLTNHIVKNVRDEITTSSADVMNYTEECSEKVSNQIQDLLECIGALTDEVTKVKSSALPMLNQMSEHLANICWNKFGSKYASKKITKPVFFEIIEDIKSILTPPS